MKRATQAKAAPVAEAFVVRAARGYQRPDGGVVWSGMLYKGDAQVASFHNDGNGGCNSWDVRSAELFAEFGRESAEKFPDIRFEQSDHYAGQLWDAATMKAGA